MTKYVANALVAVSLPNCEGTTSVKKAIRFVKFVTKASVAANVSNQRVFEGNLNVVVSFGFAYNLYCCHSFLERLKRVKNCVSNSKVSFNDGCAAVDDPILFNMWDKQKIGIALKFE